MSCGQHTSDAVCAVDEWWTVLGLILRPLPREVPCICNLLIILIVVSNGGLRIAAV